MWQKTACHEQFMLSLDFASYQILWSIDHHSHFKPLWSSNISMAAYHRPLDAIFSINLRSGVIVILCDSESLLCFPHDILRIHDLHAFLVPHIQAAYYIDDVQKCKNARMRIHVIVTWRYTNTKYKIRIYVIVTWRYRWPHQPHQLASVAQLLRLKRYYLS